MFIEINCQNDEGLGLTLAGENIYFIKISSVKLKYFNEELHVNINNFVALVYIIYLN